MPIITGYLERSPNDVENSSTASQEQRLLILIKIQSTEDEEEEQEEEGELIKNDRLSIGKYRKL